LEAIIEEAPSQSPLDDHNNSTRLGVMRRTMRVQMSALPQNVLYVVSVMYFWVAAGIFSFIERLLYRT